jgi:hypothetical protein
MRASLPLASIAFGRARALPHLSSLTATATAPSALRRSPAAARSSRAAGPVAVRALRNFDYPEAILFDCDGVLCETERDGHRVTFNMTFKEKGLPHEWGVEQYGELLKIGGGRAGAYAFTTSFVHVILISFRPFNHVEVTWNTLELSWRGNSGVRR